MHERPVLDDRGEFQPCDSLFGGKLSSWVMSANLTCAPNSPFAFGTTAIRFPPGVSAARIASSISNSSGRVWCSSTLNAVISA